jgi:hypothetical protein
VLEIYPTGETGYKTAMTLSRLLEFVHELVVKVGGETTSLVESRTDFTSAIGTTTASVEENVDPESAPPSSGSSTSGKRYAVKYCIMLNA